MKRAAIGTVLLLAACQPGPMTLAAPGGGGGGAFREFLVIGNSMTFEQCRARGGLIIRDRGSPMVACDPSVTGQPVPEEDLGASDARAAAEAAELLNS